MDDEPPLVGDLFVSRDYATIRYAFPVTRARGEDATLPAPPAVAAADATGEAPAADAAAAAAAAAADGRFAALVEQPVEALEAAATDFDLTGQIVWLVSVVTAHYVAAEGWRDVAGRDVLELGAGTALVGLVASRWAASVCLTDNEDEVLALMRRNLRHVPPPCAGSVAPLSWGDAGDHAALEAATGRARFPVLLGADIVYWSSAISPLIQSVVRLLARPHEAPPGREPVFILGYNNRVDSMHARLLAEAAAAGLAWRVVGWDWLDAASRERYEQRGLRSMTLYRFTWVAPAGASASA